MQQKQDIPFLQYHLTLKKQSQEKRKRLSIWLKLVFLSLLPKRTTNLVESSILIRDQTLYICTKSNINKYSQIYNLERRTCTFLIRHKGVEKIMTRKVRLKSTLLLQNVIPNTSLHKQQMKHLI